MPEDDDRIASWRRIVAILRPYWPVWAGVFGVTIFNSFLGQLGPQIQKLFVDLIAGNKSVFLGRVAGFEQIMLMWLGLLLGSTLIGRVLATLEGMTNTRVRMYLRQLAYTHLLSLPISYFQEAQSGKLMSRISRGVFDITAMVGYVISGLLPNIASAALAVYFVSRESGLVGALVLVMFAPYVVMRYLRFRVRRPLQEKNQKVMDNESGRFVQAVGAIRLVKSFVAENFEANKFWRYSQKVISNVDHMIRVENKFVVVNIYSDLVSWGIYAYIGWLGISGEVSVGTVVLMIQYVRMIRDPLLHLDGLWWQMADSMVGAEEYVKLIEEKKEATILPDGEKKLENGKIEFVEVGFGYTPEKKVLRNLSFEVEERQTVAIVGRSGEGKSTITSLLLRLYDPCGGEIRIGGRDIKELKIGELRASIGVVMQDTFLFDETVMKNMNYGKRYTRSQVVKALKEANAWEFVRHLPDGLQTVIGERGVKLSGGQKQRLAIARVLLQDPPILVFDEATSSLDTVSERMIQETVRGLSKKRTVIIIAHRMSTVREADRILVLDGGRVVESGTHNQLLRYGGVYSELVRHQHNSRS